MDPNFPLFIYAHSMGASIIISHLLLNPSIKVAGLIVSAPPLGMNHKLDFVLKFVVKNVA